MTIFKGSFLYRLWTALAAAWPECGLAKAVEWLRKTFRASLLGRGCHKLRHWLATVPLLNKEGVLSRSWRDSWVCRGLTFLLNLPGTLLGKLAAALGGVFSGSGAARAITTAGHQTALAQGWLLMLLWVIPFSAWNNAYSLMAFAFLLGLFYLGAMGHREFRLDLGAVGVYPVLFFCAVFFGWVFSYTPATSQRFFLFHLAAALCVLVTVSGVRHADDLKRLCAGGGVCVLVSSVYGIIQRIQGVEVNPSYVDLELNAGMPGRVMSFFDNPNTFAEVLILLLPVVLALVLSARRKSLRAAALAVFVLGVAALVMTYSRASWVGFAVAMVVFILLWRPRYFPVFLVLCLVAVPFLPATVWNRILTIGNMNDSSTASRLPLYEAALRTLKRRPITGAGLGTPPAQAFIRDFSLYKGRAPYVHAHNFFLEVWLETGLLGIISFLSTILWSIKKTARAARHNADSPQRTIMCAAAASMAGSMVCGVADYLWNYPRVLCIFWFVFALVLAGAKLCAQAEKAQNTPGSD